MVRGCTQRVHGREATLDHFLCRKAHAGKPDNSAANIFTACRRCNSRRGCMPALTFALENDTPLAPDALFGFAALERILHALGAALPRYLP